MNKEELEARIEKVKNIAATLPDNTISYRKKKSDFLAQELGEIESLKETVLGEVKRRYLKIDGIKENSEIALLKEEEKKLNVNKYWNNYNTPYEKMHLDYYLYQLHRYYKEDLKSINTCLNKILESFKNVGITLTEKDFNFHPMASEYMKAIINHKEDEEHIHSVFESIYWKCSNILRILEINFKSLYYKNIKDIEKEYERQKNELIKNHNEEEIKKAYNDVINKRKSLEMIDSYNILHRIVNRDVLLVDIRKDVIEKKKNRFFITDVSDMINILKKLNISLSEYECYTKYQYLIIDMRQRLDKKNDYKDKLTEKLKEIETKKKELYKVNEKLNKDKKQSIFSIFSKKEKKEERNALLIQEILSSLEQLYEELDEIKYNDLIYKKLTVDSPISEGLKLASSNYLYFVKLAKEQDDSRNIKDITKEYNEFKNFMETFDFSILDNILLLEEKNLAEIISARYKLWNLNLEPDDLNPESIEEIKKTVHDIIFADNLLKSSITSEDIEFYLEVAKTKLFNS